MIGNGLAFILAFTKTDTLSRKAVEQNIEAFLKRMRELTEEDPAYVLTSTKDERSRTEILSLISSALLEKSDASE
jgi:GTP-binding protein EngB required for normal cell division